MFLSGLQPCLRRVPKPLMTSCRDTVPDVGSAAPITQAERNVWHKILTQKDLGNSLTITVAADEDSLALNMAWNSSHSVPDWHNLVIDCERSGSGPQNKQRKKTRTVVYQANLSMAELACQAASIVV